MGIYAPLIDRSYFEGELNIGQVNQQEVEDELVEFIRRHEYDFMVKLMGLPLYNAFYAGMQGSVIDTRWQVMAYGKFFVLDSTKVKTGIVRDSLNRWWSIPDDNYFDKMPVSYRGLLKRPNNTLNDELLNSGYGPTSPIAKYVYYWWMRSHATSSGGVGESIQKTHNGTTVSNTQKMCQFWNEMRQSVLDFYYFLDMNIADYPEYDIDPSGRFSPGTINQFNFL
jgi:hypothetical protein